MLLRLWWSALILLLLVIVIEVQVLVPHRIHCCHAAPFPLAALQASPKTEKS